MTPREYAEAWLAGKMPDVEAEDAADHMAGMIVGLYQELNQLMSNIEYPADCWKSQAENARRHADAMDKRADAAERERDQLRRELKTMTAMWNGLRFKIEELRKQSRELAEYILDWQASGVEPCGAVDAALGLAPPAPAADAAVATTTPCDACNGTGKAIYFVFGSDYEESNCHRCHGTGAKPEEP